MTTLTRRQQEVLVALLDVDEAWLSSATPGFWILPYFETMSSVCAYSTMYALADKGFVGFGISPYDHEEVAALTPEGVALAQLLSGHSS